MPSAAAATAALRVKNDVPGRELTVMRHGPVAATAHRAGSVVEVVVVATVVVVVATVVVVVATVVVVVATVVLVVATVVVVGGFSGMVVGVSVVVVLVVATVDVELLVVVVDVVLVLVVVVDVVVVVAGVHVHSFGWPGGTHMPGHARSPFGAVTSHCSPSSSTPLPHMKSIVWASVWKRSVTRCPMIVAAAPIRVFANGANKRASKIDFSPMRTSDPITLI